MPEAGTLALSALSRELKTITGRPAPTYVALWKQVVNGNIPAHQVNKRWLVQTADLPRIAEALGLTAS